jgi:hypothetical protein
VSSSFFCSTLLLGLYCCGLFSTHNLLYAMMGRGKVLRGRGNILGVEWVGCGKRWGVLEVCREILGWVGLS